MNMNWLRNTPLRESLRRPSSTPPKDCDPTACYESFRKHWQQIHEIIVRTQIPGHFPQQDDVLGMVNHLDQLVTLLLLELRNSVTNDSGETSWRCLEHLLSENLLDQLFSWSLQTGRYGNAIRLELMKLYELLVSNSRHQLLVHEPFVRPLLRLLASCSGECFPHEIEKRLVVLLNQLCVSLMQNVELLDLFFYNSSDETPAQFIIFSLLIPFVHREGGIGQQARDALLLCISLSKKNQNVGNFIAEHSNVCPVLATGLSGLYSVLPRKLVIETEDWHRLTPDDINELPELTMFMNSLEFCNAVVQVAHPAVREQMLEFLNQGFLVPVMGPALLQDSVGKSVDRLDSPEESSTADELITATAYLDLFLRSITEPGLLYSFVRFILQDTYDNERILDILINRIHSKTRLCLVTLALFETLVDLNCEDVMLELVLRYLVPCTHVMLSQRRRIGDLEPYCRSADKLLGLSAGCSLPPSSVFSISPSPSLPAFAIGQPLRPRTSSFLYDNSGPTSLPSNGLYGFKPGESLYGNYHAYLCDARRRIRRCSQACRGWIWPYDGVHPPRESSEPPAESPTVSTPENPLNSVKMSAAQTVHTESAQIISDPLNVSDFVQTVPSTSDSNLVKTKSSQDPKFDFNSANSNNDSSKSRTNSNLGDDLVISKKINNNPTYLDIFNATPNIGPFLDAVLRKLEALLSNSLYINLHLTGLISRLAVFPHPLLHSFLLNHSLVFQPSIRSLFQVLSSLKHKIDSHLSRHRDYAPELIILAQEFLVGRETRLANARKLAIESASSGSIVLGPPGRRASVAASDPFSRGDSKRRSLTSRLSSMLGMAAGSVRQPREQTSRLESLGPESLGYRFVNRLRSASGTNENSLELTHIAMCAVLLDEWLKELAAITQEHTVFGSLDDHDLW